MPLKPVVPSWHSRLFDSAREAAGGCALATTNLIVEMVA